MNWAINQLPSYESMDLRYQVNDTVYQTNIHKRARETRVGNAVAKAKHAGAITYDWPEQVTYETLDVNTITISMLRADIINDAKKSGQLLPEQEVTEQVNPQIDWNIQPVEGFQMGENGWNGVLREEERELINEFLEV